MKCEHTHNIKAGTRMYASGLYRMRRCNDCGSQYKAERLGDVIGKQLTNEQIEQIERDYQTSFADLCDKIDALPIDLRKKLLKLKYEELMKESEV